MKLYNKIMVTNVFSKEFLNLLKSNKKFDLNNIDVDLIELFVAGIVLFEKGNLIWIVKENENLKEKGEKLNFWFEFLGFKDININFYKLPFEDPYINNSVDFDSIVYKTKLMSVIPKNERSLIITTLSALNIRIENISLFKDFILELNVKQKINRNNFKKKLNDMGYRTRDIVDEKGDVAWRGSIIDVFPVDMENPIRVEFEGNQIVSIRVFDDETQKSIENIESVTLPVSKFFLNYKDNKDFLNKDQKDMIYLTELLEDCKFIFSDINSVKDEFNKLIGNFEKIYNIVYKKDKSIKKPSKIFNFLLKKQNILYNLNNTFDDISSNIEITRFKKSIKELNSEDIETIKYKILKENYKLFVCSKKKEYEVNLKEYFGDFCFLNSYIPFSFENRKTACFFLCDRNYMFFKKQKQIKGVKYENLIQEIKIGDYIVHKKHGVGKFIGFKQLNFGKDSSEFLKIEYYNKVYLYVPVYELNVLSKYIAFEGYIPKIDKMGGNSWQLKQKRAKKSIVNFAKDLLELYAVRKSIKGYSYLKDYEMENQLEHGFIYVETEDQKKAIRDVDIDLRAETPMDRLICGDVSFGKTEVAVRASCRVVSNNKQVLILCPTTILAFQHFRTFKKRFDHFPVRIALLSRMVPKKERIVIKKELEDGRIDIVIGTHALISNEIKFKDLGLYIIDEEQRFGVFQKEKLKKNREDIDVLTLSATPIPRTLSFTLAGLQDVSIIQSPPIGRRAIKNYVGYFSKEILISAILSEIERDGLVYIVYNNIDKIYTFMQDLSKILPEVSFTVINAKMKTEDIEKNLMDFIYKKYRVLISTTIIENGIDIPEVNTLVVMEADKFGLTQLYQLRGRIGRSNKQAYAYFLVKSMNVSDKAKSRLNAIREFAELGSGYKLAEFDLKLRGAGSLLGNKQHGHIEALGFDYYHELLNKAIKELKGEKGKKKETKIEINFSYSIDPGYIKNNAARINFYKSILEVKEIKKISEIKRELIDLYGKLPESIERIFFVAVIRIIAFKFQFEEVDISLDEIYVRLSPEKMNEVNDFFYALKGFNYKEVDKNAFVIYFKNYIEFVERLKKVFLFK